MEDYVARLVAHIRSQPQRICRLDSLGSCVPKPPGVVGKLRSIVKGRQEFILHDPNQGEAPGSGRVSLAQAPGTRSTGSATDTLTTAPAPPLRLGDALEQLQLQMAMTATKAVGPYAAAPVADERVAAAPADEVRLPERFEELQLFSSTADASLLSAPEDASLLSAPEDAGLYSKLESGGAFNIAEKVLPLANDLKRLSTARYFFSLRARIVPHVTL
jgi:hypothetical protein